jgi:hypothetical protein
MHRRARLTQGMVALAAATFGAAQLLPRPDDPPALPFAAAAPATAFLDAALGDPEPAATATAAVAAEVARAVGTLGSAVRPLSNPRALENAFRGYFAFRAAHPQKVRKPYLYFVDYGLPSTAPRGYVFDMKTLSVVEGPFTVAHGRGSSTTRNGVPTRFSNVPGSATTSLGLFVARETYNFVGKAAGRMYSSTGLRLDGVSGAFNDRALLRRVVAHGAPYVTPSGAGRSEGCPAMEPARARRLLPKLANGGLVFLFAPDAGWLAGDPWLANPRG